MGRWPCRRLDHEQLGNRLEVLQRRLLREPQPQLFRLTLGVEVRKAGQRLGLAHFVQQDVRNVPRRFGKKSECGFGLVHFLQEVDEHRGRRRSEVDTMRTAYRPERFKGTLAAGLAVHSVVQEIDARVLPDLKWPNDVLINEKKFCGILTEMNAEITRVRYIVVGLGINVNQSTFPTDLQAIATSLRLATGTEWSRLELCAALLKSLDREYRGLLENPEAAASILRRFQERSSSVRGRQVEIEEHADLKGVSEGLDSRGFLQVRTAQGIRTVLSGTVRLR